MSDFLITTDSGLLDWVNPFSTKLTATPTAYGCTAAQATSLSGLVSSYSTKLAVCKDPATRGPAAVLQKDEVKKSLITEIRALARQINGTQSVTNDQRQALGLNVRKARAKIPVPAMSPHLDVTGVNARVVSCRVHGDDGRSRAFPPGCKSVFIFTFVGINPPEDPSLYTYFGTSSKTQFDVVFPASVSGAARVWITAAWANPSNETGVACTPVGTFLQAGSAAAA